MNKMAVLLVLAAAIAIPVSASYLTATDDQKAALQNLWQGKLTAEDIPLLNEYNKAMAPQRELMQRMRDGELTASDVDALNGLKAQRFQNRGKGRFGGCPMLDNETIGEDGLEPLGFQRGMHRGMMGGWN
ncbi:MAG: hypothetical protein ABH863_05155 [Candidatus Micrarchaeota archaeon]